MTYLLDSNVFIEAKNRYYGFDFCPAFWDWIIEKNNKNLVFSIEKVSDELAAGSDELATWASQFGKELFLVPDDKMNMSFGPVSRWTYTKKYDVAAINTFFQSADYYLVAYAHAHDLVIVTHEVPSPTVRNIKIPNVCIGLGIKCVTPFEMLRKERARFILGPDQ